MCSSALGLSVQDKVRIFLTRNAARETFLFSWEFFKGVKISYKNYKKYLLRSNSGSFLTSFRQYLHWRSSELKIKLGRRKSNLGFIFFFTELNTALNVISVESDRIRTLPYDIFVF